MELLRTFCDTEPLTLARYLTMQRALMRRFIARGGTEEEFCARLAPVFRRKYGALLVSGDDLRAAA